MTSVLGTTVLVHQLFIYDKIDFDRLTIKEILFARLAQERMNKLKAANSKSKKQPAPAISYEEFVRKYGGKVQKIYFYPLENKAVAIVGGDDVGEIVDRHKVCIFLRKNTNRSITITLQLAYRFSKICIF